jgi:phosphoserine phosphatase
MGVPTATTALCLDVDGTLYRDGSVFVESVGYLPFVHPGRWSSDDRRAFRRIVGLVGRHYGGRWTERRWRTVLRAVDVLGRVGGPDVAVSTLDRLRAVRARVDAASGSERPSGPSSNAYDELRVSLLTEYGRAIGSHRREPLGTALREVLGRRVLVDDATADALRTVASPTVALALVTDMPATIAEAFADTLDAPVRAVAATRFETDPQGRFTGEFRTTDKAEALAGLLDRYDWERVVAVGDTVRDLRMRSVADQFVAVAGQGRIGAHLSKPYVTASGVDSEVVRETDTVYVPRAEPLGRVLRTVLPA